MSTLVIGDIGWRNHYHLGDDAMTEAAITQLSRRGHENLVLTAGHPDAATELYGLPAVPRFGFSGRWNRERSLAWLEQSVNDPDFEHPAVAAMRTADALVIAGGGNLNSRYFHLAFDRICAVRLASRFGVPVFVSSQTVGPLVSREDEALIMEIPATATLFGARDGATYDLVSNQSGAVRTMDDAAILEPADVDHELPARFLVGSFAPNPDISGMSDEDYIRGLAGTLDRLAMRHDAEVLLIPHIGSLQGEPIGVDERVHADIVAASSTGRLQSTGMLSARAAIGVTSRAILSISTRYHPTVYAPMVGTPAIGLALNYYSSIRMRGALENVGMADFVAPAEIWHSGGVDAMVDELIDRSGDFEAHTEKVKALRTAEMHAWWDAVSAGIRGVAPPTPTDLVPSPEFRPEGVWRMPLETVTRVSDLLGEERLLAERQEVLINELEADIATLSHRSTTLREEVARATADLAAERRRAEVLEVEARRVATADKKVAELQRLLAVREAELEHAVSRRSVRYADAVGRSWRRLRGTR